MQVNIPVAFKPLFNPHRYKVFHGGRGSAKSRSVGRALLIKGSQEPLRILCTREYQQSINDSVKKLLEDDIDRLGLGQFYQVLHNSIRGVNGTLFLFHGLRHDPHKIKSMEGIDIAWVEEAATVSQESLDLLIPTIRKPNSEIWFTYNARLTSDPVHQMFVECKKPRPGAYVRKVNYDENPFFPEVLRVEMEYDRDNDYDRYLHVWLGKTVVISDAVVFKDRFVIKDFKTPANAKFMFGADWGFSTDPTTLIRFYVDELAKKLYIDYEVYRVGVEIDKLPAFFDKIPEARKWVITADNARPETISYVRRQGFRIKAARKGKGSIEDGIERLKGYEIIVHPRCKNVIYELSTYSYKRDRLTQEIMPVLEDKNNHAIDALRYGSEGLGKRRKVLI